MGSRWLREPLAPTGSEVEEYGLWSSPDGNEWTWLPLSLETIYREDPGPWDSYWMVDVAERSGSLLAVVGTNHYEGVSDEQPEQYTLVFASSNGESWERVAVTSIFEGASIGKVLGAAPGFIAVGENGAGALSAWVSEDGSSWSKYVLAATGVGFVGEIIEFDDHFVVLGWDESGPITWTSEDGTEWMAAAQSDGETAYGHGRFHHNIAVIGPNLIATGKAEGEPLWWISHDGIMWSQGLSESGLFPKSGDLGEGSVDLHINDIFAIEGDRLVALGFHGGGLTDGLWVWSPPEN